MRSACRAILGLCLFLCALDGVSQPRTSTKSSSSPPRSRPTQSRDVTALTMTAPGQPTPARFAVSATRPQEGAKSIWDRWLGSLILAAIGSGAGAFGGAWIVFWLQGRKEERQRRENEIRELQGTQENEVRELRRLQFALINRISTLDTLWSEWLRPAQKQHGGHWAGLPGTPGVIPPEPLGLERIEFILQNEPNLFGQLHLIEQGFQSLLMTANRYSEWRDETSRRIEERSESDESDQEARTEGDQEAFRTKQLEGYAGPFFHYQLKALAASLYERCPYLRREVRARFDELADHIRTKYNAKPLGAVIEPPEGIVP